MARGGGGDPRHDAGIVYVVYVQVILACQEVQPEADANTVVPRYAV